MDLKKNPIDLLKNFQKQAMGFSFNLWQTLNQKFLPQNKASDQGGIVAVDIGQSHLLVLALERKKARPLVTHFHLETRPLSPEDTSEKLRQIFKTENLPTKNIRVALKGQGVVIRMLTFPQMKKEDFSSAIRYEIEKYIPFKSNEVALDFQILKERISQGNKQVMEVLLVAAKHPDVYQLMRLLQNADLETSLIDVGVFAVANFVECLLPEESKKPIGFLDVGTETTGLGIINQGKPVFIREISFGGGDVVKLLKRKLGLEPEGLAAVLNDPALQHEEYQTVVNQSLESFLTELKLTLNYYSNHVAGADPIQTLIVLGGGSRFFTNLGVFEKELGVAALRPDVLPHLEVDPRLPLDEMRKNQDLLPVALGLCLRP